MEFKEGLYTTITITRYFHDEQGYVTGTTEHTYYIDVHNNDDNVVENVIAKFAIADPIKKRKENKR